MRFGSLVPALRMALVCAVASAALPAQSLPVPARSLPAAEVTRLCAELQAWFTAYEVGSTRAFQRGGASAYRQFADTTIADSADLVIKGSGNYVFFSRRSLVDSVTRTPADTIPDRHFAFRPAGTSVGLMSSTRALYVRRYMEIDSATVARGMTRIYAGMEAGTLVRTAAGWRMMERVNSTGSLGVIDSTTSRVRPWQCR